ncbi:hypothetical protein EJ04DRAFT_551057 [Polyplosphaeria fusca]|uniref:Uncharacterized protein n=1 Tax=Polyplosphaeria fusca TaxID=682080 RepID=A0A9P4R212_9PLEO|nr:hypothetical protein EJ04DRAFT_551057 [Polyplosphaeria fusca]
MKTFFVALFALPAALAAPTASAFPIQSVECACMNAAGETRVSGTCQYQNGTPTTSGPEYCYRAVSWAREMNTVFNNELCPQWYGEEWTKGVCRPVKLCQRPGLSSEYYARC